MKILIKYHYMCVDMLEWSCCFDSIQFKENFCSEILSTVGVFLSDNKIKNHFDLFGLGIRDVILTNNDGSEIDKEKIAEYDRACQSIRGIFISLNIFCNYQETPGTDPRFV